MIFFYFVLLLLFFLSFNKIIDRSKFFNALKLYEAFVKYKKLIITINKMYVFFKYNINFKHCKCPSKKFGVTLCTQNWLY